METTHHVNSSADEDAIVERPEEGDKETNEARDEIDPCKIVSQEQRTSTTESYVCCSISGGWRGARRWRSPRSWSLLQERPEWRKQSSRDGDWGWIWRAWGWRRNNRWEKQTHKHHGIQIQIRPWVWRRSTPWDRQDRPSPELPWTILPPESSRRWHSWPPSWCFLLEVDSLRKSSLHLEKEPVVGMEEKKEPMMLQAPRAIISWLASRGFPPARRARC